MSWILAAGAMFQVGGLAQSRDAEEDARVSKVDEFDIDLIALMANDPHKPGVDRRFLVGVVASGTDRTVVEILSFCRFHGGGGSFHT